VALYLARHAPARVRSVMTLGTICRWDTAIAARETRQLDAALIQQKVPHFAETLRARHTALAWEQVLIGTAEFLLELGREPALTDADFAAIPVPVRLAVGDRDRSIDVAATLAVSQMLPRGQLEVLPATPHPIERVDPDRVTWSLAQFIQETQP
jgi:pimeloyl-ACP methyl ester carboxylesterase